MASYGSGFAQGMASGSALVSNIINMNNESDRQDQRNTLFKQSQEDREQKGLLYKAYNDYQERIKAPIQQEAVGLMGEFKDLAQRNEMQQQTMEQFNKASAGDLTSYIMNEYKANGGKVNDQTYALANGIGESLFKVKNDFATTQQNNQLFGLKVQELQKKITSPQSNEGKLAQDMGVELTPELIAKNPTLFGKKTDTATSNMKDFSMAKSNPEYADFLKGQKGSQTSNLEKEYNFAKQNGYEGSPLEFVKAKKEATTTPSSTQLDKLMQEQKRFQEGTPEFELYSKAIKLKTEGRESEAEKLIAGIVGMQGGTPKQEAKPEAKQEAKKVGDSPYPDGTVLKGKDGKQYKVVNGKPVAM